MSESAKKRDLILVGQKISAGLYLLAAVLKPFPQVEDVADELERAARANEGTWMEVPSQWFAAHPWPMIAVVMIAMIALAVVYYLDRGPVRTAAAGNIAMLGVFVATFHRMAPVIFVIDGAMIALAVAIIVRKERQRRAHAAR